MWLKPALQPTCTCPYCKTVFLMPGTGAGEVLCTNPNCRQTFLVALPDFKRGIMDPEKHLDIKK